MSLPRRMVGRCAVVGIALLAAACAGVGGRRTAEADAPPAATRPEEAGYGGRFVEFDLAAAPDMVKPHVVVWLPPGYDADDRRYPVVYMHDGQNLFFVRRSNFQKVWAADRAAATDIGAGRTPPFIIVGIDQPGADRTRQYMPARLLEEVSARTRRSLERYMRGPNLSDAYLEFIVGALKPRIDHEYRTLPDPAHTAIVGSSMGGLISLYAITRYPQVFGLAGCVSTHWPLGNPRSLGDANPDVIAAWRRFVREDLGAPAGRRIWFDHGTETLDARYAPYQDEVDAALAAAGWTAQRDFVSHVYPGAAHEENAWAARLPALFAWLLGPGAESSASPAAGAAP